MANNEGGASFGPTNAFNATMAAGQVFVAWYDSQAQLKAKESAFKFKEAFRAIQNDMQQFVGGINKQNIVRAAVAEEMAIATQQAKEAGKVLSIGAASGASEFARRVSMQEVNRNAAKARTVQKNRFVSQLTQAELDRYGFSQRPEMFGESALGGGAALALGATAAVNAIGAENIYGYFSSTDTDNTGLSISNKTPTKTGAKQETAL